MVAAMSELTTGKLDLRDRVAISGSTVFVLVAFPISVWMLGLQRFWPKFTEVDLGMGMFLVYLVLPCTGGVAAVWSAANLIRQRKVQFAIELLLAIWSLMIFYYEVLQVPVDL